MKKPRFVAFLLALTLAAVLIIADCGFKPAAQAAEIKTIKIRFLSSYEKTAPSGWYLPSMIDFIHKHPALDGKVVIEWIGGPEVIPIADQVESVMRGTIDMVEAQFSWTENVLRGSECIQASPYTHVEERENGVFEWLEKFLHTINVQHLGYSLTGGYLYLYSNKKITDLSDFKGLRFRASPATMDWMTSLGIVPIVMPWGEVYNALETGLVAGVGGPMGSVITNSLHEVLKYMPNHGAYVGRNGLFVNKDFFDRLPEFHQNGLRQAIKEWEPIIYEGQMRQQDRYKEICKAGGVELLEFPDAMAQEYVAHAYDSFWETKKKTLDPALYAELERVLRKK